MTLNEFFEANPRAALAFSGGVDSSYLLYAGLKCGAKIRAYYVKTPFQPRFETEDALRLAQGVGAEVSVLSLDILQEESVVSNPPDRCYHCKKRIFAAIARAAAGDGFGLIIDGTNASDDAEDRPGMRALRELSVRSPLRECGLSKDEIRRLSREAGLFTWDKPAYACLATRIPAGEEITGDKLRRTEAAEDFLFSLGFRDFRVRMLAGCGRIQLPEGQIPLLLSRRREVLEGLKKYYGSVLLDLEVRGEQRS